MSKYCSRIAFLLVLTLFLLPLNTVASSSATPEPTYSQLAVTAKAALLAEVDKKNGQKVLWQKQASERLPIASTTKIATALLVLQKASLYEVVTVPRSATLVGGNKIGLKAGEQRTVKELLYALLLNSANDAAATLATHISGNEQQFAQELTRFAQSLGAINTKFINGHGLAPGWQHFSTAYDLFLMTKAALKSKQFKKVVATRKIVWRDASGQQKVLENSNQLLTLYPYATGVKTGFTNEAGYCLVATAEKEGRQLIVVVLGAPSREASFNDAKQLFNFGFTHFQPKTVVRAGKVYGYYRLAGQKIPLRSRKNVTALVYTGKDQPLVYKKIYLPKAKQSFNQVRPGYLLVTQFNQTVARTELVGDYSLSFFGIKVFRQRLKWLVKQVMNLF